MIQNRTIACYTLYIVCFYIFVSESVYSQGWKQIYPAWEVNAIHDMLHWNGDTVFACGNEWTLLRSTDTGETWEEMFDYTNGKHFRSMETDGNEIFIYTWRGRDRDVDSSYLTMYAYQPYSMNLREIEVPRKYRVQFEDDYFYTQFVDSTLFVLEANYNGEAYLHSSSDLGLHWTSLVLPVRMSIANAGVIQYASRMHFISRNLGVIVCADTSDLQSTFMYRTSDAGSTWEKLPAKYSFNPICMADISNHSGITTYMTIGLQAWKSTDTCKTWIELGAIPWKSGNHPGTRAMDFVTSDVGYIVGAESDVYGTRNGGATWAQVKEKAYQGGSSTSTSAIAALKNDAIIVSNEGGHFFRSSNAGLTWDAVRFPEFNTVRAVTFKDAKNGVVTAFNSNRDYTAFRTSDRGATWTQASYLMNPNVFDSIRVGLDNWVVLKSDTILFFQAEYASLGLHATIFRLTDLGTKLTLVKNWDIGTAPSGVYSAVGELHFVKGPDGTAYSYDEGKTWGFAPITDSINTASKINFSITDEGGLVAYCSNNYTIKGRWKFATVFKSVDSCRTWNSIYPPINREGLIWDLDVLGPDDVIFNVTWQNGSEMYRTTDGGNSWNLLNDHPPVFSQSFYFPPVAYRLESPGLKVYKSEDMWDTKSLLMNYNGYTSGGQIYFDDEWNGWIVSDFVIYHTSTGGVNWVQQPFTVQENAAITSIYPNPVSAGQQVSIDIAPPQSPHAVGGRQTPLHIAIYDLLGREVATLYNGPADPGTRTLTWQPSPTLPTGMYVVRMSHGEKVWAKQVAVLR